ncbi:MAG TPA: hypothetical protein VJR48_02690, partial [Ktedonobacterales bacterium]|nr:hypothetical protein [Ktedonobacterales bacterium]
NWVGVHPYRRCPQGNVAHAHHGSVKKCASGFSALSQIEHVAHTGAIANAVYHATGIRVRDPPITLDKLLR